MSDGNNNPAHPLKITVDGKTAWEGKTEPQFGYVTVGFTPVRGSVVRLTLTGLPEGRNRAPQIVELAQTQPARPAGPPVRPALTIVEAEFYNRVQKQE